MNKLAAISTYRSSLPLLTSSRWSSEDALTEQEAAELAARMLDVSNEVDFDHLLGTAITHAAARSGTVLSPAAGSALGGLLKSIARRSLADPSPGATLGLELEGLDRLESEFEANLQFVRLAGEAARQAAEEFFAASPDQAALASVATAAEIYAPSLTLPHTAESEWGGEIGQWNEVFEYDPEMEYFLGGLIRSAGKAIKSAVHAVGDLSSSVADTLGKVPIIGAGLKGLYGFTYGALIGSVDSAVSGVRLDKVLSRHFENQIKNVKEVAPYVQTVISFVPGIGPGVSGAISAGLTLAQGRPISEALVDAAAGALPGGALAKSMAKMAFAAASGKPLSDIAVSALPLSPAAKDGLKAGLRIASDVAQGKRVDKALVAEANRQIDKLPPAFRTAAQVGVALGQGKSAQDIALQQLPNLIRTGGPLAAVGQKIASSSPIVWQARDLLKTGRHGFDVAQGLMAHPAIPRHQIVQARRAFRGDALKAFDAAMAMHKV
jgi:hypothetical protein